MRAVTGTILRRIVVVDKVPAMHVIDVAVSLIVNAVARNLTGIGPNICRQVGVSDVDS